MLKELGLIPLIYKGNINKFDELIDDLLEKHHNYCTFIEECFLKNKKKYIEDNTYNYSLLPDDCRSNSALENYNK